MGFLKVFQLLEERTLLFFELKFLIFKFKLIHIVVREKKVFFLSKLVNLGFESGFLLVLKVSLKSFLLNYRFECTNLILKSK